jgi:hypothetical protein
MIRAGLIRRLERLARNHGPDRCQHVVGHFPEHGAPPTRCPFCGSHGFTVRTIVEEIVESRAPDAGECV